MNVLYFFPHAVYPAKTGAHIRALQTLASLNRLGAKLHLVTYKCESYPWSSSANNAVSRFLCNALDILPPVPSNSAGVRTKVDDWFSPPETQFMPDYFGYASDESRDCMRKIIEKRKIDFLFMCYPVYSGLVPMNMGVHPVLEMYDMWTHNGAMQKALQDGFDLGSSGDERFIPDGAALDRNFLPLKNIRASPLETRIVQKYGSAIAISRHDEKLLQGLEIPNVTRIPVMVAIPGVKSACIGDPCLALGPNLLNLQGLAHFMHRIMPHVLTELPDFNCDLYGTVPHVERVNLGRNVTNLGFVENFGAAMCRAGFFINPVFSGTGMQIKTVEAMSFGLPPVCYDNIAEDAGVKHLENGWVAKNEKEFAEGIVTLSHQPELRKKLGNNAREHIRNTMSEGSLDSAMSDFLSKAKRDLPN